LLNRCLDDGKSREFCNNLEVTVSSPPSMQGVDGWQVSAVNTSTDEFYGTSVRVDYLAGQDSGELPERLYDFSRARELKP
ncbi:MAG TPA: hypothetical protein PKD28_02160, partial [Candidatus Saccharibacteria bacterium]|nr:hypothetical protein [Candidatus Saccharibacteria bacterium]